VIQAYRESGVTSVLWTSPCVLWTP
jgi:hypothetical protein